MPRRVNAGGRDKDLAHIEAHMEVFNKKGGYVKWHIHDERTLLALQVSAVLLPTCWCSLIALIDDCHTRIFPKVFFNVLTMQ